MIIGTGIDIVRVDRIANAITRWGGAFEDRVFTSGEKATCRGQKRSTESSRRASLKEAVLKAFGTGHSSGVKWVDIEVTRDGLREALRSLPRQGAGDGPKGWESGRLS